mgnify:CR=1 FL=1
MLKPTNFKPSLPQRNDPNFLGFMDKIKDKSKNELSYMLFLAVEALAIKDQQELVEKGAKEAANGELNSNPDFPAPESPDGA